MTAFQKKDFEQILSKHGFLLNDNQKQQFKVYAEMLKEWNQRMNLTAIDEENAVYEKHFLDSLLPLFDIDMKGTLCDVGAGAGFPSLPMKIMRPDLAVTIVEPLGKRITFLKAVCEQLQLEAELINERAEDYVKMHREEYDVVTARAVANLPMLSELCIPLVKKQGIFLAMKGAGGFNEHRSADQAIQLLGCEWRNGYRHVLSDGSVRINLVYEKTTHTPKQYPRSFAQIKKHPL